MPKIPNIISIASEFAEVSPDYLARRKEDLLKLAKAIQENDYEAIRATAHKTKGSAASYGFKALTDIAAVMQDAAISRNMDSIKNQYSLMRDYLETVVLKFEN